MVRRVVAKSEHVFNPALQLKSQLFNILFPQFVNIKQHIHQSCYFAIPNQLQRIKSQTLQTRVIYLFV
jgi:hypothetical protein